LNEADYAELFQPDVPIHFNYHGYGQEIKGLLFGRPHKNISVANYMEEGSTTTPFDMMLMNEVSRYHVAKSAVKAAALKNDTVKSKSHDLLRELDDEIKKITDFVFEHGVDPDGTYDLPELTG